MQIYASIFFLELLDVTCYLREIYLVPTELRELYVFLLCISISFLITFASSDNYTAAAEGFLMTCSFSTILIFTFFFSFEFDYLFLYSSLLSLADIVLDFLAKLSAI